MIDEIMEYNRKFVENKGYEPYLTSKYPDKKLAILTCMDTRLLELLPAALGIKNGDAKIIKNAGGVIVHPYGSVVRSLLVGILELGVEEVMVIGHTDCGVQGMDGHEMLEKLVERGIDQQHIDIVRHSGIDLERWLGGFESVESSVHETVRRLKEHPLMPKNVRISGFIMDSATGELTRVADAEPFGGSSLVSIAEGQNMQNDILADLVQGLVQVQGKGRCECFAALRLRMRHGVGRMACREEHGFFF